MILPDLNCLLYAVDSRAPQHSSARAWLEDTLASPQPVGLAWPVVLGFARLGTHPSVFERPLEVAQACRFLEQWLSLPQVRLLHPTEHTFEIFVGLLKKVGSAGNLTTDALIAALALEHGGVVYTNDFDFQRFPNLLTRNPLE